MAVLQFWNGCKFSRNKGREGEGERERERDGNLKEFGFDFELRCEEWETILSWAGGIVLRERLR